jgi:hypothetical protein
MVFTFSIDQWDNVRVLKSTELNWNSGFDLTEEVLIGNTIFLRFCWGRLKLSLIGLKMTNVTF